MKQLLLSALLLLFSISIFAQSAPVSEIRVLNATKTFGVNIPAGTKIYNITTNEYWVCKTGALAGASLGTPGAGVEMNLLNPTEQTLTTATGGVVTLSNGSSLAGTSGVPNTLTFTGTNLTVTSSTTGGDGVINLAPTQGLSFNQAGADATGTANTINIQNGTSATLLGAIAGGKAGLLTGADKQRLDNMSDNVGVYTHQSFEATDQIVTDQFVTLSVAIKASSESSILVSVNGMELNLANGQYDLTNIATGKIAFTSKLPISKYDAITVTYIK